MQYFMLIIMALMWSFVGVMVKAASSMVSSSVITLSRFLFGVVFLGILLLIKEKKIKLYWKSKWIWIAVVGKCVNYIFENAAIAMGNSYGNVVVWPVQAIFITVVAVIWFKEEMYLRKLTAVVLCVVGVMMVSWRGASLQEFIDVGLVPVLFFALSAIGAGVFVVSQKMLIEKIDSANMNFSIFLISTIFMTTPLPFTFSYTGNFSMIALLSLIGLGFITGISFYLNALVLKKVPLLITVIVSNTCVLFTLLWSRIFFKEDINGFILVGVLVFFAGIVLINIPKKKIDSSFELEDKNIA